MKVIPDISHKVSLEISKLVNTMAWKRYKFKKGNVLADWVKLELHIIQEIKQYHQDLKISEGMTGDLITHCCSSKSEDEILGMIGHHYLVRAYHNQIITYFDYISSIRIRHATAKSIWATAVTCSFARWSRPRRKEQIWASSAFSAT